MRLMVTSGFIYSTAFTLIISNHYGCFLTTPYGFISARVYFYFIYFCYYIIIIFITLFQSYYFNFSLSIPYLNLYPFIIINIISIFFFINLLIYFMKTHRTISINQHLRPKSGKLQNSKIPSERTSKFSSTHISTKKVQEQIRYQMEKTQKVLQEITNTQTQINSSQTEIALLDQYRKMQQQIRRKDIQIKQTQKFIKQLQNGSADQQRLKNIQNMVHFEIKEILDDIKKIKYSLNEKKDKILHKKQKINILKTERKNKLAQTNEQIITFQQFTQKYFKRSKQMRKYSQNEKVSTHQTQSKKRVGSNRQKKQNSKQKNMTEGQISIQNKKIKDILIRKNVAETALKTAKKKHLLEMSNYRSKLEFLFDQNQELQNKLNSKLQQLKVAEAKFCQRISKSNSKNRLACRRFKCQDQQQ